MNKENIHFTAAEETFFKLIRLALFTSPDCRVRISKEEWKEVYDMACKQAVAAIVLDGVELLPPSEKPPTDLLMPWISLVQHIEKRNRQMNRLAVMVCDKFKREGMGNVLLKGQGNATLYPRPLHRTPGDIDLWVDAGRKTLTRYARKYNPGAEVLYHHVDFHVLKDAEIELHFTPSWMNEWPVNRRLQRYFREWKKLSLLHRVELPEGVGEIPAPTLEMNRIYLLIHIYRHLFDEGIGLRQLMDYYFVLLQPCDEKARAEAVKVLGRLRLKRFASAVMYVMQEVFGLPADRLLLPPSPRRGKRLLHEIMLAGNFGQHDRRIRRQAGETPSARFLRKVRRNAMFLGDYPSEAAWSPLFKMWHYVWRAAHGYLPEKRKPTAGHDRPE